MNYLKLPKDNKRLAPTLTLVSVVLLATWLGYAYGGYFLRDWALIVFLLAVLALIAALAGALRGAGRWGVAALGLLTGYTVWTAISLLWSPNKGDAWFGTGQTLLYLLAFAVAVASLASGASRRWVLAASVLGPAVVAASTLASFVPGLESFFDNNRLIGTVGYYNGEAAFLLTPFWAAVCLAGSRRTNPAVRGLVLAGATLGIQVATLTQSRGALVAMAVSLAVFFVLSGQRLRGLLALIPVAGALLVSFPGLNEVYLTLLNRGDPTAALDGVVPTVWLTSAAVGLYGLLWGLVDRAWEPPASFVRVFGGAVLIALVALGVFGGIAFVERSGNPVAWGAQKWEDFKTDDNAGQEQSRYVSASGSGRYVLWQVAWEDFAGHPFLGIGTHNYEATYYQFRERPVGYARQPHMLPLEVLAERGVVGGALFFGFLAACLASGLRQRFGRLNAEGKALVGGTTAAVAYWFVHSSAEWFWQLPAVTLPAMVYLAVLVVPWDRQTEDGPSGWPVRVGVAVAAVVGVAAVVPLYAADRYLTQSFAAEDPKAALVAVERAQKLNPLEPRTSQREASLAAQIGDRERAVAAYQRAIRLNPEHFEPYTLLAAFYEQTEKPGHARTFYLEALARNPLQTELDRRAARLGRE